MNEVVKEEENGIEVTINEKDVKKEEIDDNEYQHMIPHEYRDYLEEQPTNSKKIPAEEQKMLIVCEKCGNGILLTSFTEAKEHAATHTDLKSFKCEQMIDACFPGFIEQLLRKTDGKEVKIEEKDGSYQHMVPYEYQDIEEEHPLDMPTLSREISVEEGDSSFPRLIPFEYDNYTEQQPTNSRKRAAEVESTSACQKCIKKIVIVSNISEAEDHAITHTNLKRFQCSAQGCDMKSHYFACVVNHIKSWHSDDPVPVVKRKLNNEGKKLVKEMVGQCFTEFSYGQVRNIDEQLEVEHIWSIRNKKAIEKQSNSTTRRRNVLGTLFRDPINVCQVCYKTISVSSASSSKVSRRNHALLHTDIVLYSCQICNFKTEYLQSIHDHEGLEHDINFLVPRNTIEATDDQKMEIERMYNRCFSYSDIRKVNS